MLKYSLIENLLTDRPDDYSAQTHCMATIDKDAIITRMLERGTTLTKTDILAVLNSLEEVIASALLEGYNITIPLFNTACSISGVFDSPLDSFDGNRHKLNINLTKGRLLREVERSMKFEKTNVPSPQPNIQEVKDSMSGRVNEILGRNGVVEVRGYNLKIEGDDPSCGLWFRMNNGNEYRADVLIENKPSRIIACIPYLDGDNCQISIVTQYANGLKWLKTPKQFAYPKILIVE